jgi:hypothetical protein
MSIPSVLVAVAALSVVGGCLAFLESSLKKRLASVASAVAAIASVGAYIRIVHVYNSRPLSVVIATGNPLAGLGPWDELALLLGAAAIAGSILGARKACVPLLISGILALGYTLLMLSFWD